MHHFRERLKEEERRRDEEMLQSSDSWRSAQQNGHTDNVVTRGANRLGIRSPTDDMMLDEPIVRLGRRGAAAARMRADTDPLGLRSGIDRGTARARRRASPASEDQGPTLEELLQKKAESRRQERLSEQRQLELADTLYPFGRRPGEHGNLLTGSSCGHSDSQKSRMAMMSGSRRPSASSSIEEIEDQTFFTGGRSPARIPRRARSRGVSDVTLQEDGDTEDTFPWARSTVPPRERQGALAGLSFSEKMGWSTSDHNPKKTKEENREYLESLKGEMDHRRNRLRDEILQEASSNPSGLATAMHHSLVGKPPISTALRRRTRHLL
ncbi:uncharacterized protein LOC142582045 isoform X4 [Dermacentor variabilis]|uniref:uncharacterized protein LOC142582045 isoform X4 n=1 Tax=Dermacentor variabilis TaxID=34621 RepID=UPI003F5B238A